MCYERLPIKTIGRDSGIVQWGWII